MQPSEFRNALIVGAGPGLSAALARALASDGFNVALAARDIDKLGKLATETRATAFACDATDPGQVEELFSSASSRGGDFDVVIYNAGARLRGPIEELDPAAVAASITANAFGGFLVAQQAARRMLPRGGGAILFTGASASIKGYPQSAPFAMGKFALRGLAQSMARELAPKGIHVAHVIIDGGIRTPARGRDEDKKDDLLEPTAIAATYLQLIRQPRSAWTWEVELRPWVERF
jgi:NAD(P)-dependent dehydrogenase (short-subunit alcohol dehydrogenase family)